MIESVLRGELLSHARASGWMADFGEALPCEGVALHDGREACAYHNQYPVDWAVINREALRRAGKAHKALSNPPTLTRTPIPHPKPSPQTLTLNPSPNLRPAPDSYPYPGGRGVLLLALRLHHLPERVAPLLAG